MLLGGAGNLRCAASAELPTGIGRFRIHAYGGTDHAAIVMGDPSTATAPLTRVHSSCRTGDIFASLRCDCGPQLHAALDAIAGEGVGVVVYLDQEGRGIGLVDKIRAYALQDEGLDTVDANLALGHAADRRDYAAAAGILGDLGVDHVRLLTNNPRKVADLEAHGITVDATIPIVIEPNPHNRAYLQTKAERLGHALSLSAADADPPTPGRSG